MKKRVDKNKFSNTINFKIEAKELDYLYVKKSQIKNAGKGLFTAISIYQDEVICLFKGEILTGQQAKRIAKEGDDAYFINLLDGRILDSNNVNCFAKYANDAKGFSKTKFELNSKISLTENDEVCIVALRDIKKGEEIFCSYGKSYWQNFKKKMVSKSMIKKKHR